MPIPCVSCAKPVFEQAVVCPHCGEPSGVPADPIAESEIATLPELPPAVHPIDPLPLETASSIFEPIERAVVEGVAKVVGAAFELIGDTDRDDDEPVPRAIAR